LKNTKSAVLKNNSFFEKMWGVSEYEEKEFETQNRFVNKTFEAICHRNERVILVSG
jgi:hypothetical protein